MYSSVHMASKFPWAINVILFYFILTRDHVAEQPQMKTGKKLPETIIIFEEVLNISA